MHSPWLTTTPIRRSRQLSMRPEKKIDQNQESRSRDLQSLLLHHRSQNKKILHMIMAECNISRICKMIQFDEACVVLDL